MQRSTILHCSCAELWLPFQRPTFATCTNTTALTCTGAAADLAFLSIHSALGAGAFLLFGAIAAAGGVYCWAALPETKGRSLAEVQALLSVDRQPAAASDSLASRTGGQAPYPALLSAGAACPRPPPLLACCSTLDDAALAANNTSRVTVLILAVAWGAGVDAEAGRAFSTGAGEGVQQGGWLARVHRLFTSYTRFA